MARGRMISKSLSTSRRFVALHDRAGAGAEFAQVLYVLLTAHADDFGRMAGDAQSVKLLAVPGSPRNFREVQEALDHLNAVGLIECYAAEDGDKFIAINKFDEHQSGLHKRTASKFPEPPGNSRKLPEIPAQLNGIEGKGTEGNGREGSARPRIVSSGGAGAGMNPRDHLNCRGNGSRCARICVSEKQHGVLRGRMGGNDPDGSLDAFYAEVRANLDPAQPIGDTPWKFWDAQFAAKFGTVAAVNPRTAGNAAAAARFVARGES